MQNLYIVNTYNRHNQILIFESKESAREWLTRVTSLTADEIEKEIIPTTTTGNNLTTAFLNN